MMQSDTFTPGGPEDAMPSQQMNDPYEAGFAPVQGSDDSNSSGDDGYQNMGQP